MIWGDVNYFGKHGFVSHQQPKSTGEKINIEYLEQNFTSLIQKGIIVEKGGICTVDLSKFGYDKLLGTGKVVHKFAITVETASAKALAKIQKSGGSVTLLALAKPKKTVKKP